MKKQIFTLLLFSAILMQCREELPVSEDFPIVFTTSATPHEQGFRFEGELIDDSGYEILTHGFMYAPAGREDGYGAIVYKLGNPGKETFTLNTPSIGTNPTYAYRAFVTYIKNSKKMTVYGNELQIDLKATGNEPVWNLIAVNETIAGTGECLAVPNIGPVAHFIRQDGKVTKFDIYTREISASNDFPLNANEADLKLYSSQPFVINSQNSNVYRVQENSWAVITQLPFGHEELSTGDVYMNEYYPYICIVGSFGTHFYNYRDDNWETRATFPLSPGQSIVTGTSLYGGHYILTTDGKIQLFTGNTPPSLFATFPTHIEGQAHMFFSTSYMLYVGINEPSGLKMWKFDQWLSEWSELSPFPEELNQPMYFIFENTLYVANKKANGNYDIWQFSQFE